MVQIRYKGQNYLVFGKYRFNNGYTEVKDEDFYELMKSITFAYRVNEKILEVPKDFPLEKVDLVQESRKEKDKKELHVDNASDSKESDNKNKK